MIRDINNIFERVENFHADLAWNYPLNFFLLKILTDSKLVQGEKCWSSFDHKQRFQDDSCSGHSSSWQKGRFCALQETLCFWTFAKNNRQSFNTLVWDAFFVARNATVGYLLLTQKVVDLFASYKDFFVEIVNLCDKVWEIPLNFPPGVRVSRIVTLNDKVLNNKKW